MKDALQCPSLFKAYENYFRIGAAINGRMPADPAYNALICRHFNSITADNQMKPMFVMDHEGTLAKGDPLRAAVKFDWADSLLSFAKANGIAVRYHTLAWHNQTPRWFFAKDWSDAEGAEPASKETMLARLENYILDASAPYLTASISEIIDTAISLGVSAFSGRPIGLNILSICAALTPRSISILRRVAIIEREPIMP